MTFYSCALTFVAGVRFILHFHRATRDIRITMGIKSAKCVSYLTKTSYSCTRGAEHAGIKTATTKTTDLECEQNKLSPLQSSDVLFFFLLSPCYLLTDLLTSFLPLLPGVTQHLNRRSPRCRPNLCA